LVYPTPVTYYSGSEAITSSLAIVGAGRNPSLVKLGDVRLAPSGEALLHPRGDSFYAAILEENRLSIAKVDLTGRLLQRYPVPLQ
jgi:hypothetical protein